MLTNDSAARCHSRGVIRRRVSVGVRLICFSVPRRPLCGGREGETNLKCSLISSLSEQGRRGTGAGLRVSDARLRSSELNGGKTSSCVRRLNVFALKRRLLLIKVSSSCKHGSPRPPAGIDIGGCDAMETTGRSRTQTTKSTAA